MGQGESSQLPYTIDNEILDFQSSIWKLHAGKSKQNNTEVSIFVYDKLNENTKKYYILASNALKTIKSLRLPTVIEFIAGHEFDSAIYIVTEKVEVYNQNYINTLKTDELCLGLYNILTAVSSLNNNAQMIHNNINPSAIFISKSGEWKLGSFEYVSKKPLNDECKNYQYLQNKVYISPEKHNRKFDQLNNGPIHAIDSWSCGCLIYELFNKSKLMNHSELRDLHNIPKELQIYYKKLLNQNILKRINVSNILKSSNYFNNNQLVQSINFLSELALKTVGEKNLFFKTFLGTIEIIPASLLQYRILPLLLTALTYGGSGMQNFSDVLQSVLLIGSKLNDEKAYETLVVPAVIKLFESKERAVRMHLLEKLQYYEKHLPAKLINNKYISFIIIWI